MTPTNSIEYFEELYESGARRFGGKITLRVRVKIDRLLSLERETNIKLRSDGRGKVDSCFL